MKFHQIHTAKVGEADEGEDAGGGDRKFPEGRSGHCLCADDNFLYVFGGYNPNDSHAIYNKLWRYNTTTQKWLVLPDHENMAPKTGASISMVHTNRKLITFGGTGFPFARFNSNWISMYCLQTFKWYNLTKMALDHAIARGRDENEIKVKQCGCTEIRNAPPSSKYGQGMAVSPAGKVYIFAGTIGQEFENDLHSFCLKNLYWTQHNFCFEHRFSLPEPRYRQGVVCKEDRFIVLGGATSSRIFNFFRFNQFEYAKKTWKIVKCVSHGDVTFYPEARHSHVCVEHEDKVYLIGGLPLSNRSLNDIWVLDLRTLRWKLIEVSTNLNFGLNTQTLFSRMIFFS